VQLKQGVDLKLTFEYEAAQIAQGTKRGPEKVVEHCKNTKVSRKNTKTKKKYIIGEEKGTGMLKNPKKMQLCEI